MILAYLYSKHLRHNLQHNFDLLSFYNHHLKLIFSMKRNILILLFGIIAFTATAQTEKRSPQISVYPNPATEYIKLSDEDAVRSVSISNMLGRKVRTFEVTKGEHYDIGDLPNGLYLIQIVGKNNKILTTQRLTKRS
jgi:hypothetical protein